MFFMVHCVVVTRRLQAERRTESVRRPTVLRNQPQNYGSVRLSKNSILLKFLSSTLAVISPRLGLLLSLYAKYSAQIRTRTVTK